MSIVININSGKDFEPVSEGLHAAVLAAVIDKGMQPTPFGEKHKVMFVFLTDEADPENGSTKLVFSSYTASLHEKSTLRKAVKAIRGKDIEGENFDIESLVGAQVQLVIQHTTSNQGKVYANIQAYMKPKPGTKVPIPADFKFEPKKKDGNSVPINTQQARPNGDKVVRNVIRAVGGGTAVAAPRDRGPITDEDIPF